MEVYVLDEKQNKYTLPTLFSWRLCHGCGEGCDDFDLSFAYDPSQDTALRRAVRLTAFEGTRQVFCGLPDEWTVSQGNHGRTSRLFGRGLQALLLDDEADPAHFAYAGWNDITTRYVTPKGIAVQSDTLPSAANFHIESGMNLWQVVTAFAQDHAGRHPRFAPDGRLLVKAFDTKASRTLELPTQSTNAVCTINRHGVIAETLVRNRDTLRSYTLKNETFPGPGGRRQVVTGVGWEGVAQIEKNARQNMRQSLRGFVQVSVTLPWAFAAWPGETLQLNGAPGGWTGVYVVWEAESSCDMQGGPSTRLTLIPPQYL